MYELINYIVFGWYPYLCLTVFLLGSVLRFDREQYTWRSGSSQLLRRRQLTWGSNLFHVGILVIFLGHFRDNRQLHAAGSAVTRGGVRLRAGVDRVLVWKMRPAVAPQSWSRLLTTAANVVHRGSSSHSDKSKFSLPINLGRNLVLSE